MMHLNNLKVLSETPATTGEILNGKTIRLAGFELSKFMSDYLFFLLKVDGAYSGIRAGYMDVFIGAGYQYSFNKNRTNLLGKFSIGAAGGGGVDTNGGFMIAPDFSVEQKLFGSFYLALNGGYMLTPDSKFKTATYGLGLKYKTNTNGVFSENEQFTKSKFKGFEIAMVQDIYFDAKRITTPTENMYQLSLQLNFNLNEKLFVAGQTSFANFGNAGAYAEGIVGLGIYSNSILQNKVNIFGQVLAGAAGGGNISTGEGLIFKPSAGIDYKLSETLKIRTSFGYVKALGGELSNTFVNLGIKYHISFLQSKKK